LLVGSCRLLFGHDLAQVVCHSGGVWVDSGASWIEVGEHDSQDLGPVAAEGSVQEQGNDGDHEERGRLRAPLAHTEQSDPVQKQLAGKFITIVDDG
jgi:hypothetical protein